MSTKQMIAGAMLASFALAAPVEAQSARHILGGAAIGAAGGAVAGALIPGLSVGTGALVGAGAGATIRALDHHHSRRYYGHRGYYRHGYRHYYYR